MAKSTVLNRTKGKHPKKEKGEAVNHVDVAEEVRKVIPAVRQSSKLMRGIQKAWNKSAKFLLQLDANTDQHFYLDKKSGLTTDKKLARVYAFGFDNPDVKIKFWNERLQLKFKQHKI